MLKKEEMVLGTIIEVGKKITDGLGGKRDYVALQTEPGHVFRGIVMAKTGDRFVVDKLKKYGSINCLKVSKENEPDPRFYIYWCEARISFNKV